MITIYYQLKGDKNMNKKVSKGIVLVCDRISSREGVDLFTDTLEFTSDSYFNAIDSAIKETNRKYTVYNSPAEFIDNISKHKNDIVFAAIWSGTLSRNRKSLLPAICESYGIEYIGADVYAQTICQDKNLSKIFCRNYDIEIPNGYIFDDLNNINKIKNLKFPVIVKPNCEGSSIGISDENIADSFEEAVLKAKILLEKFSPVLIEEYIDGQEVSICLVGRNIVEYCEAISLVVDGKDHFEHKIWGYETKKCGRSLVTRKNVTKTISDSILKNATNIFRDLGKIDYMRIDGRINNGKFYLIELTPDCSLHPDCFMANTFYSNNKTYSDMIKTLIALYDN